MHYATNLRQILVFLVASMAVCLRTYTSVRCLRRHIRAKQDDDAVDNDHVPQPPKRSSFTLMAAKFVSVATSLKHSLVT